MDLLADHIYVKMVIVPAMGTNLFKRKYDMVVQPAERSPNQPFCYEDVSFGYFLSPNYKGLACLSNEVI